MTEMLLVRHGETLWNREGRVQGYRGDSGLTDAGHAQAQALGRRFAAERIDALHSSDAGRTRQTVAPITAATGLPVVFDSGVREHNYGVFEGLTFTEVERDFPEAYARFRTRDPHFAPEGGESMLQFRDRVLGALGRIAEQSDGGRVVVVTHGGVLGAMYRHAMNIPLDAPRSFAIANAGINCLRYERGVWQVVAWCDVSHLPETVIDDL